MADDVASLLPREATGLERVFEQAGARIDALPVPNATIKTPSLAPGLFLKYLAGELSTDLWSDDWADAKMRSVTAATLPLKTRLGTLGAIRAYLEIEDAGVIDAVTPPQMAFYGESLTSNEYADWLARLPQIRVYFREEKGTATVEAFFDDVAFFDDAAATFDTARSLLGRHAFSYDPETGVETPLTTADIETTATTRETVTAETASTTSNANHTDSFVDLAFADASYLTDPDPQPQIYSWSIVTSSNQTTERANITVSPSLLAIDTRPDRVQVILPDDGGAFADLDAADLGFALDDSAEIAFYDRIYLANQNVVAPVTEGSAFYDISRFGIDAYTAELLIDTREHAAIGTDFFDEAFADDALPIDEDATKRERLCEAILLAQSGRDRVKADWQRTRAVTFGDAPHFDGSCRFSERLNRVRL